jgi:N,N'-diacetyllegionaminate synthase
MAYVDIGGRRIGDGSPCYVIAEIGVNHNASVDLAHRLIDAAADGGADAVKFQTFDPALLAAPDAATASYQQTRTGRRSQREMLAALELPRAAYPDLFAHARERRLTFLSTPFDEGSADFLDALGVEAYKTSSGDLTHGMLLQHIARKGKPMIVSTGMSTLDEVTGALETIRHAEPVPVVVLHCVSSYPAEAAASNLRTLQTLRDRCHLPVGLSDHTCQSAVAIAAVALGACVIEKHLTLDRAMAGPDHAASADPDLFRSMVGAIREVEQALGSPAKTPTDGERAIAAVVRRSLYWRRSLARGEVVRDDDLIALRPATGLPADRWRSVTGRRTARATEEGTAVSVQDLDA